MLGDERIQGRQWQDLGHCSDFDFLESRLREEATQRIGVAQRERRTRPLGHGRAEMARERFRQPGAVGVAFDRVPNRQRAASGASQYPAHLAQRRGAVGEELQPLLANHGIEARIRKRQSPRIALLPVQRRHAWRRQLTRKLKHPGIHIEARDSTTSADAQRRRACDHAGAAREVEHAPGGPQLREIQQILDPGTEHIPDRPPLVLERGARGLRDDRLWHRIHLPADLRYQDPVCVVGFSAPNQCVRAVALPYAARDATEVRRSRISDSAGMPRSACRRRIMASVRGRRRDSTS